MITEPTNENGFSLVTKYGLIAPPRRATAFAALCPVVLTACGNISENHKQNVRALCSPHSPSFIVAAETYPQLKPKEYNLQYDSTFAPGKQAK
mmetsp:Transcript_415/g.1157  ORF Transcript_415/g.1157 Transcript_415/m.1157 type:complete len:93 (-) Transcript_415:394-672(-)